MKTLKPAVLITIIGFIVLFIVTLFVLDQVKDRETLYQVSVLNGLMKGDYEGKVRLKEIQRHGDFGIGTFDHLDGEAIELDNVFYQIRSDGVVRRMKGSVKAPFAMTTFFSADMNFSVPQKPDYNSLQEFINGRLPTKNIPYAVKIVGKMDYIKVRSVPAQTKPYPLFSEVAKKQSVFEFYNIEGTLAGFRMPDYMQDVNIPGYHMHFLSSDRKRGGHVLGCAINRGEAEVDKIDRFAMALPESADFYSLDFSQDTSKVSKVEKGK